MPTERFLVLMDHANAFESLIGRVSDWVSHNGGFWVGGMSRPQLPIANDLVGAAPHVSFLPVRRLVAATAAGSSAWFPSRQSKSLVLVCTVPPL